MKRCIALLLILLLTCSCAAADFEDEKLAFDYQGMDLLAEWEGETSDTNKWILLRGNLTNWALKSLKIEDNLSATMVFRDKYVFEAVPVFGCDIIDPLVELDGGLLFCVPNMVAASDAERLRIVVNMDGEEQEIPFDESLKTSKRRVNQFECDGFDTPEEAVEAYISAFNMADVASMLSTFAIETCVDNADALSYIKRLRYAYRNWQCLPKSNDYIREIQIAERYASLGLQLFNQYVVFNTPEEYSDLVGGGTISLKEDGAPEAFVEAMSNVPMEKWFGKIELAEVIQYDQLEEIYSNERIQANIQRMADSYGCDELVDISVLLKIDGIDYLLIMQCARYGDKWYNLEAAGTLGSYLGIDRRAFGLESLESVIEDNQ